MKSELFSEVEFDEKTKSDIANDLVLLSNQSNENIVKIFSYLARFSEVEDQSLLQEICADISKALSISKSSAAHIIGIMYLFSRYVIKEEYKSDKHNWTDDLIEQGLLQKKSKEKFEFFLSLFTDEKTQELKQGSLRALYRRGYLPYFDNCKVTVEDRAVLDYDFKEGDDIKKYSPKLICKIPLISVCMQSDARENSIFYFQASPDDIKHIIDQLTAALITIDTIKK